MNRTLTLLLAGLLAAAPAAAERWFADPQRSKIVFSGELQSGPVEGTFSKYWVDMFFNPDELDKAYVKANIDTTSVNTPRSASDPALRQQQWLYTMMFPQAVFESRDISRTVDGQYLAKGTLNLRGVVGDATLRFSLAEDQTYDAVTLSGSAQIEELDFGLGDTPLVDESVFGNTINIQVDLYMRPTLE